MPRKATAHDHEALAWCLRQGHVSHHQLVTWRPDFLRRVETHGQPFALGGRN